MGRKDFCKEKHMFNTTLQKKTGGQLALHFIMSAIVFSVLFIITMYYILVLDIQENSTLFDKIAIISSIGILLPIFILFTNLFRKVHKMLSWQETIFSALPVGVAVLDNAGRLLYVNKKTQLLFDMKEINYIERGLKIDLKQILDTNQIVSVKIGEKQSPATFSILTNKKNTKRTYLLTLSDDKDIPFLGLSDSTLAKMTSLYLDTTENYKALSDYANMLSKHLKFQITAINKISDSLSNINQQKETNAVAILSEIEKNFLVFAEFTERSKTQLMEIEELFNQINIYDEDISK